MPLSDAPYWLSESSKIIALKSTVHFRDDFEPIAERILHAEAPGANYCRLDDVP
ncbi:MlrC C-terminal domain-containing protein [Gammaproteobacteria bacterium]|nr:MlrC C-terminal domain-containing protein [Gammaproteobacteria bacterium]MDG2238159.1 MlrC C-terminal domain-containing protein [Arenicellales bacterium]